MKEGENVFCEISSDGLHCWKLGYEIKLKLMKQELGFANLFVCDADSFMKRRRRRREGGDFICSSSLEQFERGS